MAAFQTSYDDTDDHLLYPRIGPPLWFKEGNKEPCDCFKNGEVKPEDMRLLMEHIGYSDYLYRSWMCPKCKKTFVDYVEG